MESLIPMMGSKEKRERKERNSPRGNAVMAKFYR